MGISIPTVNGFEVTDEIAYRWIREIEIRMPRKNPGRSIKSRKDIEKIIKEIETGEGSKLKFYDINGKITEDEKYLRATRKGFI